MAVCGPISRATPCDTLWQADYFSNEVSPLRDNKMVHDAARKQMVVFGGYAGISSLTYYSDTWVYGP
jgi:hypothetical protein